MHHWLFASHWQSGQHSLFRRWVQRSGPVIPLCKPCHHRVSRWDAKPGSPLAFVPALAGLVALVLLPGWWLKLGALALFMFGLGRSSALPLVTFAAIVFGWARNAAVLALVLLVVAAATR